MNTQETALIQDDRADSSWADDPRRASMAYLRMLLDHTAGGFYAIDCEGRTLIANTAFLAMLGFAGEAEALGRRLHDVVHHSHPDGSHYHARDCPIYRCARDGVAAHVSDEVFYRLDGTPVPVEYWAHPIIHEGTLDGAICTFIDVTDRVAAERALRESEAQFRAFSQAMLNHVWTAPPDGRLDWFNERVYEYSGAAHGELDGDGWARIVHPDDLAGCVARWTQCLATGSLYETEFRLRRADGMYRWHIARAVPIRGATGEIVRWIGTNTDIEEQKTTADALAFLNATLEEQVAERTRERDRVWRTSRDLFVIIGSDGTYKSVNPAWTDLLGYPAADLLGLRGEALVHPADLIETRDRFAGVLQGLAVRDVDLRLRAMDGSYRWFSWNLVPEDGEYYATGRDITDRKQLEEQLRQSQKMEAVGQLTGGLAHDFNNLLTGIAGSLELLQSRLAQGRINDLDRYITAAQGASRRAAALTHRLLAFSRRQTLDPKPIDVNHLIGEMEELIRRTVGPAIALEVVGAVGLWATRVDPHQLENALLNLCINARDAMPDGGRLIIETANRWLDDRTGRARDLPPGQYVSLCVSDNGTGMPPEVVARAFDPFFTTKPIGMGTGLGLSMIYGFVRQSGGQVRIYSEVGQGSMVCLYLPRHLGGVEWDEATAESADLERASAGQTVLVVDDEPTVRMLVTEVLEELGYAAIEAVDGAAGLKILQSGQRVDLLVTDVGLPGGMNGRQVADAGRALRPELNVLFITGYAENAVLSHGHLDHGMHVLTKPFTMEALARRIKEIIDA